MAGPESTNNERAGLSRQQIQAYGGGGFRISGARFDQSVLVRADHTEAWSARDIDDITASTLFGLVADAPMGTIVIVGCGPGFQPVPAPLREHLMAEGLQVEWMDTGAACRTFNVLVAEGREVRAALLAVA